MNKKLILTALAGVVLGYVAQKYIAKVPLLNKLPVLG